MRNAVFSNIPLIVALWMSPGTLAQNAGSRPETKLPPPLVRAHAHNDYEHARPLLDALDHGFCSIEADIWLVEGKLLVAHDRNKVKAERTLQTLYLEPLRERARVNGGRVYRAGPSVVLLVDVKSAAEETYLALREVLGKYRDVLTVFRTNRVETNAITVIISGNRAPKMMAPESPRYAFIDGRLEDLPSDPSTAFIPLISADWRQVFKWLGNGPLPDDDRHGLQEIIAKTHGQGRKLRFWGTPDKPEVWQALLDAGVDLLNTDDLGGMQRFLLGQSKKQPPRQEGFGE